MTVGIEIGTTAEGEHAILDLEELLATRLLVQGNSGSGKSHLLRRLLEQSASWVQQAVIDPEGDFVTLADRYGHLVIEASSYTEAGLLQAAERVREHRVSVVLNLEGLEIEAQMRHTAAFLSGLFNASRDFWYPMLVVVDEAQLFAPAVSGDVAEDSRKLSLSAMTNLMCRGRKRGLAGVIATQRLAKLAKNVAAEATNFLMGRTFLDIDMARAADLLGIERRQAEMFRDLQTGQFIALGPALSRRPLALRVGTVETQTRGVSAKLIPLPEAATESVRGLILNPPSPQETTRHPHRRQLPPSPPDILTQLAQAKPIPAPPPQTPLVDPAERKRKLGLAITQLLGEPDAAFRSVSLLYQDFLVRCRIHGISGTPLDLPQFRQLLANARAGIDTDEAGDMPEWQAVIERSLTLPEDLQGVFLLLARAALDGAPCPSDDTIAQAYGSRSLARARRLLSYMEEQGTIICRQDMAGRRIVTLPLLGCETAPGAGSSGQA